MKKFAFKLRNKKNDSYIIELFIYKSNNQMSFHVSFIVNGVMTEYEFGTGQDIDDIIHKNIDHYVSNSSIKENIEVINQQIGGIYQAMKKYEQEYGEFGKAEDMEEKVFYARLAFISIQDDVREEVNKHIELNEEGSELDPSEPDEFEPDDEDLE